MEYVGRLLNQGAKMAIVSGLLVLVNLCFDFPLYTIVMCKFGVWYGVLIMSALSIPFNHVLIAGFEWVGTVATDAAKSATSMTQDSKLKNFMLWVCQFRLVINTTTMLVRCKNWVWRIVQKSRLLTFVALAAYDPVPAMLFIRNVSAEKKGNWFALKLTDRAFFAFATVLSNGLWATLIYLGIEVVQAMEDEIRNLVTALEFWLNAIIGRFSPETTAPIDLDFLTTWIGACVI